MNILNKDSIRLICEFLKNNFDTGKRLNKSNNNSFRQCSKYLSIIVGHFYFSEMNIYMNILDEDNKYLFRYFVHKY